MRRSARLSSFCRVPVWGTQAPPPHAGVNPATEMVLGPVNVEFAGVAKSTWNRHARRAFDPKSSRVFDSPAGGEVDPSRSEGSRLPNDELSWKHTWMALFPAIM